ncbi:hypothetical protein [Nocardia sp. NPDC051570]|uniref:hypothetical protein n=1 Tax=Nocardia sp. NPDC051570 TaxID=3364324 RepID=UPI003787725E
MILLAAAALTLQATTAAAEPDARGGISSGVNQSTPSLGDHFVDPGGLRHTDSNPALQAEHNESRRIYHRERIQDLEGRYTDNDSGGGGALCRPHANWC